MWPSPTAWARCGSLCGSLGALGHVELGLRLECAPAAHAQACMHPPDSQLASCQTATSALLTHHSHCHLRACRATGAVCPQGSAGRAAAGGGCAAGPRRAAVHQRGHTAAAHWCDFGAGVLARDCCHAQDWRMRSRSLPVCRHQLLRPPTLCTPLSQRTRWTAWLTAGTTAGSAPACRR